MLDLEAVAQRSVRAETLGQIADLVGCSVEALTEGRGRPDLREILELMSLWPMLDAAARARLLDEARRAATA
ncbi:hypothetical protein [Methylobacterium dankookense]|uniref:Uncharacterized protein n=1 Tax=Methylobacterium dankookense TaxID=560405 RepID=A0A564G360_9HYPH|nr:hypothetical protein [Methylobacterium dankookense]GJD59062.1 hypothetical protein IFDJLNFL_4988 [Methylobacterium dankookense]VUF14717.1 hypothetical protein MTDSW087_04442 [Methylobacterium dankookense]